MSLADSIKSTMVPIHREGYPFVAGFFVGSLVLGLLWNPLMWIGFLLTAWCAYFFRDPSRTTPQDDMLVISPADGVVSSIGVTTPPQELGLDGDMLRISIFMNVFNCHINRAPMRGRVSVVEHRPGKFLNADLDKASSENERNGLVIETARGPIGVVQIAGLVARRIVCWTQAPSELLAGERFGLIRFGSRVDVYLPKDTAVRVALGQIAVGGETVIAEFGNARPAPAVRVS